MMEEGGEKSLKDEIRDIKKMLTEEQTKPKKKRKVFKLKFGQRMGAKAKIKKGFVLVWRLKNNSQAVPQFIQVEDGMLKLKDNDTWHIGTSSYVWHYGRIPMIFLPEFSLAPLHPADMKEGQPVDAKEIYNQTLERKELSYPQKVIIEGIKRASLEMKGKTKLNMKLILIIGLGIAVVIGIIVALQKGGFSGLFA